MATPAPCWSFDDFRHLVPPYGWIRDYLAYAIQCTDAPPEYHIGSAVALVSNVIADEQECYVDGEPIPLHDFFLLTGESGHRKSAAIKRALRVVAPCYKSCGLDSRIWYPETCTPEGIMDGLASDPNRLLVLSEWSELQGGGKANYWQHVPQFWELIFDGMPIERLKVQKRIRVERPSVTILGASTPSLVQRHTVLHDWDAGKMARYLIIHATKPDEREMANAVEHPELLGDLRVNFDRLLAPHNTRGFVPTPEAKEYKDDWLAGSAWRLFAASVPEHLRPSLQRAGDHVYRVASLYQASMTYPYEFGISLPAMQAAVEFVWLCLEQLVKAFGVLLLWEQSALTRVHTALKIAGDQGISRADLLRKVGMQVRELDLCLTTLRQRHELDEENGVKGKCVYWLKGVVG